MGRIAIFAVCVGSIVGCAHVQPTTSWPELVRRLAPGTPVAVVDARGTEVRGRVSALSATSLTLRVAETSRQFDSKDVRHVRRDGDPLWNGLAIGAAFGALENVMADYGCSGQPRTCDGKQVPARLAVLAVSTAAGIGIDALRRDRTSLYGAPRRATLAVIPVLTRDRKSLWIVIHFSDGHR